MKVWCSATEGQIASGERWVRAIYAGLAGCTSYAVLVGTASLDGWVESEISFALNVRAQRPDFAVFPILLPGRDYDALPTYLQGFEPLHLPLGFERDGPEIFANLARDLGARAPPEQVGPEPADGPFPGLEFFDEGRARFFFGRSAEVRDLCERLGRTPEGYRRWLHVHGGSGSGKSSLVRAGLVPAIRRGWLEDAPKRWLVAVLRPGRDPDQRLAEAVAGAFGLSGAELDREVDRLLVSDEALARAARQRTPKDHGLLIVVDQLEEAFTHGGRFERFDGWLAMAMRDDGPIFLVTTVRSDFLHRFEARLPKLFNVINERASSYQVGRVRTQAMPVLIEGPARLARLELEPGLPQRLLTELDQEVRKAESDTKSAGGDQPSDLPLVAHALRTLWLRREGNKLVHRAISGSDDQHDGLRGLIAASADQLVNSLPPEEHEDAWRLLLALVRTGRGEPDMRKTISLEEANETVGRGEQAERLLARLSGGRDPAAAGNAPPSVRLITVVADGHRGGRVDLVHEVLLRCWKSLRDRVDAHRRDLERRDDLHAVAEAWVRGGRESGGLPEGGALEEFGRVKKPTSLGTECLLAARAKAKRRKLLRRVMWFSLSTLTTAALVFAYAANRMAHRISVFDDDVKLTGLKQRADSLWPYRAPDDSAFATWLEAADDILSRELRHREDLQRRTSGHATAKPISSADLTNDPELMALQSLVRNFDGDPDSFSRLRHDVNERRSRARTAAKPPDSAPGDAVHVVPAAPDAHRAFSVSDMLAFERVSELCPSPDGKRVAFTLRRTDFEANRGRTNLWLLEADGSLRQLTTDVLSASAPRWAPAGDAIFFLSTRTGSSQIWRMPASGGDAIQITSFPIDITAFALFGDGKRLALAMDVYPSLSTLEETSAKWAERAANKSKARVYDELLFRHWDRWEDGMRSHVFVWNGTDSAPVDLMKGWDVDCPTPPFGGSESIAIAPDGSTVVFAAKRAGRAAAWSTNIDLWAAPSDGSSEPRSLTAENLGLDDMPAFSPDGRTLAYASMPRAGYESDRRQVMLMDWKTGVKRPLAASWDRSADSLAWSLDSSYLIVAADDVGQRNIFELDVRTDSVRALTETGTNDAAAPTAQGLFFLRDDLSHPAEIHFLTHGEIVALERTHINDERLRQVRMGAYEQFTFVGARGDRVFAWLVKPVGFAPEGSYPVILLVHGGPQGSMGNHFHYRWNPQVFAGAGFATLLIDFHGSTGYGQAFSDAVRGDWGGAPYEDLMKGLDHALANYPFLDGARAGAAGASYGAYMINWIQGQTTRFKALVAHSGILDRRMAYYDTEELWSPEWDNQGLPWDNPEPYAKQNPMDFVNRWQTPELVIHGASDFRRVETQSMAVFTALQRRGIPSRFLYFPDENHWILKPQNSVTWHDTVMDWFHTWLK